MPSSFSPPIIWKNNNAGTAPSWGCIEITGADVASDGTPYLTADQPDDDDGSEFNHFINSHKPVNAGDYGECYSPVFPVWCAYNNENTPAFGQNWGPESGEWRIGKDSSGFLILGAPNTTDTRVLVVQNPGVGCELQNAIMHITVFGTPTGGTFTLAQTIGETTANITLDYNESSAGAKSAYEAHSAIDADEVMVSGGALPGTAIQVEFQNDLANTNIAIPISNSSSLTGGSGVGVIVSLTQLGVGI